MMMPAPNSKHRSAFRRRLLSWYGKHQRRLPWRAVNGQPANAYHVLVSEAMLQQTQVATVIDYFNHFMAAFPTLARLAEAEEQRVLKLWQGLGYYRRARNLHAAARLIVDQYDGKVPDTVEALIRLPGVGRYTAGAIASIAHNTPAPILDGNVARVLARVYLIDQPVDAPNTRNLLWQLAEALVSPSRPGDFNQAVMELGALVCSKANPACDACPLAALCRAREAGQAQELPVPVRRKAPRQVHHHIFALKRRGQYLFQQRPASGLWSNMWQLPTSENHPAKLEPPAAADWVHEQLGLKIKAPSCVHRFKHQTTHRTIHFHLWQASVTAGRLRPHAGQWRALTRLDDLPLPNPQRRAIESLMDSQSN